MSPEQAATPLRERRSFWFRMVEERRESGLSLKEFCKSKNLCHQTYSHWDHVYRMENTSSPAGGIAFAPVPFPVVDGSKSSLAIQYESAVVTIDESTSPDLLKMALSVLKEVR